MLAWEVDINININISEDDLQGRQASPSSRAAAP
jgi:hypothetical protein